MPWFIQLIMAIFMIIAIFMGMYSTLLLFYNIVFIIQSSIGQIILKKPLKVYKVV